MKNCTIANWWDFILTKNDYVIAEESDMYRKWIDCCWCCKEIQDKCKSQLISTITWKVLKETPNVSEFINKYNWNGENKNWNKWKRKR